MVVPIAITPLFPNKKTSQPMSTRTGRRRRQLHSESFVPTCPTDDEVRKRVSRLGQATIYLPHT
eukprot:scaffold254192_cov28-Prasinocladus_malaysianus.AAC.1